MYKCSEQTSKIDKTTLGRSVRQAEILAIIVSLNYHLLGENNQ